MSRAKSMRRAIAAASISLAMLAVTAAQVLATSGTPPFPK